ncbi:hypothetical protein F4604DRAFT_1675978 [Suillus subluteus]|nr:hypothetical protein F4604DRAFT_1675978 [Suillus subluteus]
MYKLFKARLAGREAARQRLAVTAWTVQEAKHYLEFSEALNEDSKMCLRCSNEELRRVRATFTGHDHLEMEDNGNYLQAVYDDECNILRAIAAQADIMGKVLGLNIKNNLLSSRGESSHRPQFTSSVDRNGSHTSSDLDGDNGNDTMDSDNDKESEALLIEMSGPLHLLDHFVIRPPCYSIAPTSHPSQRTQRKGKAAVPKPARGLGLNPSGLPAADQLNIMAEQPTMSAFGFDPHQEDQDSMQEGWRSVGQDQCPYDNMYTSGASRHQFYNDMYASGASGDQFMQYNNMYGSGSTTQFSQPQPFGAQLAQPQPFSAQSAQPQSHHFTQPQADSTQSFYSSSSQDQSQVMEDQQYDTHMHGTPLPSWIEEAPDRGVSVIDRGNGFIPPATNLALIQQGEIAQNEVVHTSRPACTTRKQNTGATLPGMPYFVPQAPRPIAEWHTHTTSPPMTLPETPVIAECSATTPKTVQLLKDDIKNTIKRAKILIAGVVFMKHTMTQNQVKRTEQFEDVIKDSTPRCLEVDVIMQNFITNIHQRKVSNTLSNVHGKMAQFACNSVFVFYKLFPPRGSTAAAAESYHITRVDTLIHGADPLLFMHAYSVDDYRNITVIARFQNTFIMAGVVRFVWHGGHEAFLGAKPLKALKNVMASVGSATHCALQEQQTAVITVDPFGGTHHEQKFKEIIAALNGLTSEERIEFNNDLQFMLDIGPSQVGVGDMSSDSE